MTKKRVSLVTCSQYPNLETDEQGLLDALSENGLDPQIVFWDDPQVDWEKAGVCVVRSVRDYADRRAEFLRWAHQVPRLLNPADVMEWGTDKHYLKVLHGLGLPIVPTFWLEPELNLSKHQIHTRFPAHGDFVVKPAVSSGGRQMGRYTANVGSSRTKAIHHAMDILNRNEAAMVQRYLAQVEEQGEVSLIYMNGILSHAVEKAGMLKKDMEIGEELIPQVVAVRNPSAKEWEWGEQVRRAVHRMIKSRLGHDQQFLYFRADLISDGGDGFYLMEVSAVDAKLYLQGVEDGVKRFADAIATRVLW